MEENKWELLFDMDYWKFKLFCFLEIVLDINCFFDKEKIYFNFKIALFNISLVELSVDYYGYPKFSIGLLGFHIVISK